jgi:DNA-binding Lrp family transcriptional regulator
MTNTRHELSAAEREVLEVIADQSRVNVQLLTETTSLQSATIEPIVDELVSAGLIREITTDLYEISEATSLEDDAVVHKGIPDPNPDTQTAPIDPTNLEDGGRD